MRILLVLLAMLTGLSLPEVAVATSRAEVADVSAAPVASASLAERDQACTIMAGTALRRRTAIARRTIMWLPLVALGRPCGLVVSDRPLE